MNLYHSLQTELRKTELFETTYSGAFTVLGIVCLHPHLEPVQCSSLPLVYSTFQTAPLGVAWI